MYSLGWEWLLGDLKVRVGGGLGYVFVGVERVIYRQ